MDSARALAEASVASTSIRWQVCNACVWTKEGSLTPLAIFGLPGYFLKGVERGFLARHLTTLQAEIFLINLRRSALAFRQASEAEKEEVLEKWKDLKAGIAKH